jgi:hypothetical protein
MPQLSPSSLTPALAPYDAAAVPVTEQARQTLERLLDLGVQVVDGNLPALLEIPATLARAIDGLHGVHVALENLSGAAWGTPVLVLAGHVARRKALDMSELDKLTRALAAAEHPGAVGRSVVIAALVLLSNLASDERWYTTLRARRNAA